MKQTVGEFHKFYLKWPRVLNYVLILFIIWPLQWDFTAFKMNIIWIKKRIVDSDVVDEIMFAQKCNWSYDFNDTALSTQ